MKRYASLSVLLSCAFTGPVLAQQEENFDYFAANRQMIRNGVQAVLMCNGLFTSQRSLEQVFDQELAYLTSDRFGGYVGDVSGGEYEVDRELRAVAIGGPSSGTTIRAAYREGIGCVVMAPDQTFDDIDSLRYWPFRMSKAIRRPYPGRMAIKCRNYRYRKTSMRGHCRAPQTGHLTVTHQSRTR